MNHTWESDIKRTCVFRNTNFAPKSLADDLVSMEWNGFGKVFATLQNCGFAVYLSVEIVILNNIADEHLVIKHCL